MAETKFSFMHVDLKNKNSVSMGEGGGNRIMNE